MSVRMRATLWFCIGACLANAWAATAGAAPAVQKIGPRLYAYISDNDASSNSTFLVGKDEILVVDTGLNRKEGTKLLEAIRRISPAPIRYIVNTHYHPDHQGGNGVVGPGAVIISTVFTREQTLRMLARMPAAGRSPGGSPPAFRPATLTFSDRIWVYVDGEPVEIYAPGPGHTMGDAVVFFPGERAVATGDLFMNHACPAMDRGSVSNWIKTLAGMLALPADHYVPGHFAVGTKQDVRQFHDYLAALWDQVQRLYRAGVPIDQVPQRLRLSEFSSFRQFPQFHATFADNAKHAFQELQQSHR